MPTTRKRRSRGSGLTDEIIAVLGVGTGINHMAHTELEAMWKEHGAQMIEYWKRINGEDGTEPFCASLAREEGW